MSQTFEPADLTAAIAFLASCGQDNPHVKLDQTKDHPVVILSGDDNIVRPNIHFDAGEVKLELGRPSTSGGLLYTITAEDAGKLSAIAKGKPEGPGYLTQALVRAFAAGEASKYVVDNGVNPSASTKTEQGAADALAAVHAALAEKRKVEPVLTDRPPRVGRPAPVYSRT